MGHIIVEIKAQCQRSERIRAILNEHKAQLKGTDHQSDTYFNCPTGRLKLRQGNIETNLIFYKRPNQSGPKQSNVELYRPEDAEQLKWLLSAAYGILVVVEKKREIYFIENIKFHIGFQHKIL